MARALDDAVAFHPALTADYLWRSSCFVAGNGDSELAEWLHEMAVELLDIRELPSTGDTVVPASLRAPDGGVSGDALRAHLLGQ